MKYYLLKNRIGDALFQYGKFCSAEGAAAQLAHLIRQDRDCPAIGIKECHDEGDIENENVVYLAFRTDPWHSLASQELIYIGDSVDNSIQALNAAGMTTQAQEEQLYDSWQSQCNNTEYEFDIERHSINEMTI